MSEPATALQRLVEGLLGPATTATLFQQLAVAPALRQPQGETVSRAELAQALNMALFHELLQRVPEGAAYVAERTQAGGQVVFDHGALRSIAWASGALPPGEAAITRVLRPLGYFAAALYPLPRLKMTGRAWRHADHPEDIAQFFVSELHPDQFSERFQAAMSRVLASSLDPLGPAEHARLERLARDAALPWVDAEALLPRLLACFARQHAEPLWADYETLLAESAEAAWIATEGNAFNHATDRVPDLAALAEAQRALGRSIKPSIEVSRSGRVLQTAFKAAQVARRFRSEAGWLTREVPGSFYEFIQRAPLPDGSGLDLAFDAGNATAIFKMTS